MRHARSQGREIGGSGRDRDLARRRRLEAIDRAFLFEAFLRIAGAIVLDTLAFSIWNVGSRSPAAAWRDVRRGLRDRQALIAGSLRFVIGALFVAAGTVLLVPAVANPPVDFAPTELFAFLVALALEHLVGADVRVFCVPARR